METLLRVEVVNDLEGEVKVFEQDNKIQTNDDWNALTEYDAVISTPNCVSPVIEGIPEPPEDLFDLVLIDEAHHSPAKTWSSVLDAFPKAKKVLFTATPFRRDKKRIKGKIIYSYPLKRAFEDEVFGKIKFEPVVTVNATDEHVAIKAQEVLRVDRERGLSHALMVRTNSKAKAAELVKLYREKTNLQLQKIDSNHTYGHIKKALKKLMDGELDGIICVDMLGEGFNFPNLKIAALHAPHKSLEVTLQFIGRFSRTAAGVDEAKFIAIPNEIELEAQRIYTEGAVWQDLITNLSENRIQEEIETRQLIEGFTNQIIADERLNNLSLFSLKPYYHVKIFRVADEFDIETPLDLSHHRLRVLRADVNEENSTVVILTGEVNRPRWASQDEFDTIDYNLIIIYYDEAANLLFINSSIRNIALYDDLAKQLTGSRPRILATSRINKVLLGITNAEFFNVGMKNTVSSNHDESYRIYSGSKAHRSIQQSDSQFFGRGHFFAKGMIGDRKITIGLSSASKVWSNKSTSIPAFVQWCEDLAAKINQDATPVTGTELDYLRLPAETDTVPNQTPIGINWNERSFRTPTSVYYHHDNGQIIKYNLTDLTFEFDYNATNQNVIRFAILTDLFRYEYDFSLSLDADFYFTPVIQDEIPVYIGTETNSIELTAYINTFQLLFYFDDFSALDLHNHYLPPEPGHINFNNDQVVEIDWAAQGVDPKAEFKNARANTITIHQFLNDNYLPGLNLDYIFYDHGQGEIADFITAKAYDDHLLVQLYIVKGSKADAAGTRVNDAYEVTGQVVRSIRWQNREMILKQLNHRNGLPNPYNGRRVAPQVLDNLFKAHITKPVVWENVLVQPGISKQRLEANNNIANNLAGAHNFCQSQNCRMLILGSH
ncbi:MAG: hypothetical protein Salg2KO_03060 [Salibacteraceae bacterium]